MPDRALFRWGSAAAVIGALLALVTNLLHPRISDFDNPVEPILTSAAESDSWVLIHVGILMGTLLIIFGLFAVSRSMKGGRADGLVRVALGSLLVSGPVAIVTLLFDGYATKEVADAWVAASGPAKEVALAAGSAVAHIGWAAFMGLILMLLGVTPALFGLAVASSDEYPAALGWPAVLLAVGSVVAAAMGTFDGPSSAFIVLFTITSGLLTLWVLALGVLLGRRVGAPTPA